MRTVRRWEREEGLPVHRQVHRVLGSVYAYKSEIESWRHGDRRRPGPSTSAKSHSQATSPTRSIAVLPFANVSADPDNEYFADGLTDEVTADLSRIAALRVISRTSAMAFKGATKGVVAIACQLGARYIVEGSVRRVGDRVRVTAQLIDAASDDHLWSGKFDGSIDDVFAIQEQIARVIVDALQLRLTAAEDRRLAARPFENLHAYECYLRARHEAWRWRKDSIDHAIQLLHNGLAVVGDHAELYAAMGHAWLQYREAGIDLGPSPLDRAEEYAGKVFALDPASASGLRLRGWIHYGRGRIQDAVDDLKAALEVEPNNADALLLLTNCYLISGRVSAARPLIERLLTVDPLTPVTRCLPAFADAMEGNFAAAVEPYRQMFEMDSGNPMARLFYVWALALNRCTADINSVLADLPSDVRDTVPARLALFLGHALAGNAASAHAVIADEIEALATAADVFPRVIAQGYALAGMPERALHWLAIAVDRGFVNYPFLAQHDPFFAGLRSDARFRELLARVRDRWEHFRA